MERGEPLHFRLRQSHDSHARHCDQTIDDGIGDDARFDTPAALALDGSGNLLIADTQANTVRKMNRAI